MHTGRWFKTVSFFDVKNCILLCIKMKYTIQKMKTYEIYINQSTLH